MHYACGIMPTADPTLLLTAISFAARAHQAQLRNDGKTPYVSHPFRVFTVLSRVFGADDLETLAAALLHDTIEDTNTDHDDLSKHFGVRVADFVAALSKDKRLPEDTRERAYHEGLIAAPIEVQLCKLADVYDNLIDSAGMGVPQRRKKIDKASQAVEGFRPGFPDRWRHVLDLVCEQIERAEGECR
jgi:guanosine-3',5'-bis(diphosphate) 3'-pyrophosphohydrolase